MTYVFYIMYKRPKNLDTKPVSNYVKALLFSRNKNGDTMLAEKS